MNRVLPLLPAAGIVGVVMCPASPGLVQAARTSTRLTPEKSRDDSWTFMVKAEHVRSTTGPDALEFTVTAPPVDPKVPRLPDRTATLEVLDGTTFVSSAPVEAKRAGANTSYTFRVAARYAEKSRFVFGETDAGSKFGNGANYWFCLADFVARPAADQPQGKEPALPEKTLFDGDEKKRADYLTSFRAGYVWAKGVHLACPTNPSEHNRHAVRGWVEGWQAGVMAGGQSDLPARYAPLVGWKDTTPVENPAARWDVAAFPKLTGKLVHYIGHGNAYVPPREGDLFVLDFVTIGKLTRLGFESERPGGTYLSLYEPLELVLVNTGTTGAFASCRFTSRSRDHALHIDVQPRPGRGDPRFVQVFITAETRGEVTMAAVAECLAAGEFPPPHAPVGK